MSQSESEIQKQILEWLEIRHIFHYRQNSGMHKIGKRYIRYGTPGAPDIIAVIKGQYVGIEVKDAKNCQSQDQVLFALNLESSGGKYILVRSVEDVEAALK